VRTPVAIIVVMTLVACASGRETGSATATPSRTPSPSPAPRAERYVAIGASDTAGVGATDPRTGSWPARLAARLAPGSTYLNTGVSGSLAAQAAREQLPAAIAAGPTLVTAWLAVNDIIAGIPPTQYARDLASVIDPLVERTSARVFVGTVPDLRAVPAFAGADAAALAELVRAYNAAIVQTASRHPGRVHAVDLFTGSAELISSATVTPDGLHPTDRGYQLIADRFAESMRVVGITLRDR
jgi:lysophospholipase L1-like esterase